MVHIIGAGLAGSEAAWQLANRGHKVRLYEMRQGGYNTPQHQTQDCAELVCSNSFRSDDDVQNAVGLLHYELRQLQSLIIQSADQHKVPAGGALAVDREAFAKRVTQQLRAHPNITLIGEEITKIADDAPVIIASGPLTSDALSEEIQSLTGKEYLAFFDAIAPIIYTDSIDMTQCWYQSRYDKGDGRDYINCPMSKEEYATFIAALLCHDTVAFKDWEKDTPYFEGCLPIEEMARRGHETLRYGPMKPVGLTNPHKPEKPYAVVQLRQDNQLGTLHNMVGFQTKLNYAAQKKVFSMIPGLQHAEFARLGGIHRNSFIHSPSLLDTALRLKSHPHIYFAGQITGVEGYVESTAMGLLAGLHLAYRLEEKALLPPPQETALGGLVCHITGEATLETFQPMNINFGLLPPLAQKTPKKQRKAAYTDRAKIAFAHWRAANINQQGAQQCA